MRKSANHYDEYSKNLHKELPRLRGFSKLKSKIYNQMKKILFLFILSSFITACRQHKKTYVADIKENSIAIDSFYHKENVFKYTQLGIECKNRKFGQCKTTSC